MSLDAIGIISKDTSKAIEFYALLGVELKAVQGEHYEGTTPSGVRLMVDSVELVKEINSDFKESQGSNVVLCFIQDSPAKVDETYNKIIEAGFESMKEPWDAFWGQRYASVKDSDGNQIDLFAKL